MWFGFLLPGFYTSSHLTSSYLKYILFEMININLELAEVGHMRAGSSMRACINIHCCLLLCPSSLYKTKCSFWSIFEFPMLCLGNVNSPLFWVPILLIVRLVVFPRLWFLPLNRVHPVQVVVASPCLFKLLHSIHSSNSYQSSFVGLSCSHWLLEWGVIWISSTRFLYLFLPIFFLSWVSCLRSSYN